MQINIARNKFLMEVNKKIYEGEDIIIVSADLASPVLDELREQFPKRFVPVGIAEQNLIAIASGIALEGHKVIAYSVNPFIVTRAYDQIRNCVSAMNIPLCMVGIGAGFNGADYGCTHYATEDIGLVKTCPNIDIYNVADERLAIELGDNFINFNHPIYLRIDKENYECNTEFNFEDGYRYLHKSLCADTVVVSTGALGLSFVEENRQDLINRNLDVIDLFKVNYEKTFIEVLSCYKRIVVVEENAKTASIGADLKRDMFGMEINIVERCIDFGEEFPHIYGNRKYFQKKYGIDWNNVSKVL